MKSKAGQAICLKWIVCLHLKTQILNTHFVYFIVVLFSTSVYIHATTTNQNKQKCIKRSLFLFSARIFKCKLRIRKIGLTWLAYICTYLLNLTDFSNKLFALFICTTFILCHLVVATILKKKKSLVVRIFEIQKKLPGSLIIMEIFW